MDTRISDNGEIFIGCDNRVDIPEEYANIFCELFQYAFDLSNDCLKPIAYRENNILVPLFMLPKKDEKANFEDLRYTIKSYRYILAVFSTIGLIKELTSKKDYITFDIARKDINLRTDTLEYYLLNNVKEIIKTKGYYDGRLEIELYRLIQELYLLALKGVSETRWMLAFNTPVQIWFILTIQMTYRMINTVFSKDRKYYHETINKVKNINSDCIKVLNTTPKVQTFTMETAFMYCISQLIIKNTPPIGTYYSNYLNSLRKQAYAITKTNEYFTI